MAWGNYTVPSVVAPTSAPAFRPNYMSTPPPQQAAPQWFGQGFTAPPAGQSSGPLAGLGGWTTNPAAKASNWNTEGGVLGSLGIGYHPSGWAGIGGGSFMSNWQPGTPLPDRMANRQLYLPNPNVSGWGGDHLTTYGQYLAPFTPQGQAVYNASQMSQLQSQYEALQAAMQKLQPAQPVK